LKERKSGRKRRIRCWRMQNRFELVDGGGDEACGIGGSNSKEAEMEGRKVHGLLFREKTENNNTVKRKRLQFKRLSECRRDIQQRTIPPNPCTPRKKTTILLLFPALEIH
jgi:hypothetical protein